MEILMRNTGSPIISHVNARAAEGMILHLSRKFTVGKVKLSFLIIHVHKKSLLLLNAL
jgi:hypothetical protein